MTVNPPGLDCGSGSPVRRVPGRRIPVRRIDAGAGAGAAAGLLLALLVGAPACAVRT